MPKKEEPLTLHELIKRIKAPKHKSEEIVPGLFSGGKFTEVSERLHTTVPIVYPEDKEYSKRVKRTYFQSAMGDTPQQVAHRAMAYGEALAGRKYIPYALETRAELDTQWIERLRCATGVSLMSEAGVEEIDVRDYNRIFGGDTVYEHAMNALYAIGTPQETAILNETKKYLKKRGYKRQAALLKPMLHGAIEAAKTKTDLIPHLLALQEMFGTASQPDPGLGNQPADGEGDKALEEMLAQAEAYHDPHMMGSKPEPIQSDKPPTWGTMKTLDIPCDKKLLQTGKKSKVWKRAGVGAFRFPWRALKTSDLQCFAVKRRVYGGTLLFDISGSMHVNSGQIKTILEHSPEATMAAYGATGINQCGEFAIIAKNGYGADPNVVRNSIGSGNLIDGPALEWLASQPEPRIWVSDGGVTGLNDECTTSHQEWAFSFAKANRIVRIESADVLVSLLKDKTS